MFLHYWLGQRKGLISTDITSVPFSLSSHSEIELKHILDLLHAFSVVLHFLAFFFTFCSCFIMAIFSDLLFSSPNYSSVKFNLLLKHIHQISNFTYNSFSIVKYLSCYFSNIYIFLKIGFSLLPKFSILSYIPLRMVNIFFYFFKEKLTYFI